MPRTSNIRLTGVFQGRDEAAASLKIAGDAALVHRGVPRMLLLSCPCGCGDTLIINLDSRAGPAWRLYDRNKSFSLFPSYWRDTKCESHFILWRNHIYWCSWDDDGLWDSVSSLEERVLAALSEQFIHYEHLAEQLQEIPWDVLLACRNLVKKGRAEISATKSKSEFRLL